MSENTTNQLEQENQYLLAKINILTNNQNKGEKDEVLLLIEIYYLNKTKQYDKLKNIFGQDASDGISILDMNTQDEILDINKLSKAKCGFKADCMIKMIKTQIIYCISIKSKNGANPAILNHTPRSANIFKEGEKLYEHVNCLDSILKEYIDKRTNKSIGEDIPITKLECLTKFPSLKDDFMKVLSYFIFEGTGKGYSKCKANAIITYQGEDITFNKCTEIEEKKEYIKTIYDTIVLSLRDKGMPKVTSEYCEPWVFKDGCKHKGSLHIRIK